VIPKSEHAGRIRENAGALTVGGEGREGEGGGRNEAMRRYRGVNPSIGSDTTEECNTGGEKEEEGIIEVRGANTGGGNTGGVNTGGGSIGMVNTGGGNTGGGSIRGGNTGGEEDAAALALLDFVETQTRRVLGLGFISKKSKGGAKFANLDALWEESDV